MDFVVRVFQECPSRATQGFQQHSFYNTASRAANQQVVGNDAAQTKRSTNERNTQTTRHTPLPSRRPSRREVVVLRPGRAADSKPVGSWATQRPSAQLARPRLPTHAEA